MMKKLNTKGITTIEVIVCFVLVVIITVIMYSTISTFNERRLIEGYKSKIYTYKNLLTKQIQDDFIKIGLTHASTSKKTEAGKTTYTVNCVLKDGTKRQLIVEQSLTKSDYHIGGNANVDDYFMIQYGTPSSDMIKYPIPELGESKTKDNKTAKDLSINNILISISKQNVLSIYIGFYHPELGTRYAINVVAPINYISTAAEGEAKSFTS